MILCALRRFPSQQRVTSVRNSSSERSTLNEFAKCWQWECHFNENCCEAIWNVKRKVNLCLIFTRTTHQEKRGWGRKFFTKQNKPFYCIFLHWFQGLVNSFYGKSTNSIVGYKVTLLSGRSEARSNCYLRLKNFLCEKLSLQPIKPQTQSEMSRGLEL